MKKFILLLPFLCCILVLQGCAGGLILVAGATVAVTSDERSISTQLADDKMSINGYELINKLPIDRSEKRVSLVVNNSYILVIGQVKNDQQKAQIEATLKTVEGVKEIYNQLRINKPISFTQHTTDTWITTKAKAQLTADDDINPFSIKVVTEDGEVFLIGRIDAKTADAATNVTRKIEGVKRVNRVFQIIPEK